MLGMKYIFYSAFFCSFVLSSCHVSSGTIIFFIYLGAAFEKDCKSDRKFTDIPLNK